MRAPIWEAFAQSTLLVAIAETGDKTQLLSFVLAARLRRPWPILAGILLATVANHALAGSLGVYLASLTTPEVLRYVTGGLFIAFGLWALVPDKLDDDDTPVSRGGAFTTALVAFFLAEMGDKTQFATITLGARFGAPVAVIAGTTLGMLAANVPAVFLGEKLAGRLPLKAIRVLSATLFVATGIWTLMG